MPDNLNPSPLLRFRSIRNLAVYGVFHVYLTADSTGPVNARTYGPGVYRPFSEVGRSGPLAGLHVATLHYDFPRTVKGGVSRCGMPFSPLCFRTVLVFRSTVSEFEHSFMHPTSGNPSIFRVDTTIPGLYYKFIRVF